METGLRIITYVPTHGRAFRGFAPRTCHAPENGRTLRCGRRMGARAKITFARNWRLKRPRQGLFRSVSVAPRGLVRKEFWPSFPLHQRADHALSLAEQGGLIANFLHRARAYGLRAGISGYIITIIMINYLLNISNWHKSLSFS